MLAKIVVLAIYNDIYYLITISEYRMCHVYTVQKINRLTQTHIDTHTIFSIIIIMANLHLFKMNDNNHHNNYKNNFIAIAQCAEHHLTNSRANAFMQQLK